MNGILVIYKEKGYTSRDVVNIVGRILGTKKIGHTGTLDPMATGVLVLCVGSSLKLVELLTNHDKEYVARIKLGMETDTLDITGTVVKTKEVKEISKQRVEAVLQKFVGKIKQEVPRYSAIKVNGKKLYEYARAGIDVELPVHEVEIYDLQLVGDISNYEFCIKCRVSKGTYIRSLVRDIGLSLGTVATMVELERIKLGNFSLEDAYSLQDVKEGNYRLLNPVDVLDLPKVIVDEKLEKKIKNGQVLKKFFDEDMAMILDQEHKLIAIYQEKDKNLVKTYRMFLE